MDLDQNEEGAVSLPSSTHLSAPDANGDKYLTVRRHTVGPGDTAHEQVVNFFEMYYKDGIVNF